VHEPAEIASDPDAFERFYREHVEAVQRFVARRVDDPYLAADLTADVFVAAIESAGTYRRSRGEPTAWLFGIARNVVAGERRRNAKELRTAMRVRGRELVALDGLSASEAGQALGIGAVAARVRLHRARRRMRSRLDLLDLGRNDVPEVTT
jgi:RNA polymerase sigma-70 factor (ECF subfamily)